VLTVRQIFGGATFNLSYKIRKHYNKAKSIYKTNLWVHGPSLFFALLTRLVGGLHRLEGGKVKARYWDLCNKGIKNSNQARIQEFFFKS